MRRIFFGAVLTAIVFALGADQLDAQVQKQAQAVNSLSHNIGNNNPPFSPFFAEATGSDGTIYSFAAAGGLAGDLVSGAGDTTNVSGTLTIVGNSNAGTNFNDGNRLPKGITLTYDLSFSISTGDGLLVTSAGNTGNGIAPGALPSSEFVPGESIEFSAATISNVAFSGTPTDPGVTFTPGTVTGVGLSQFRSNNFGEGTEGALLDNGTDTIGFGVSIGTVASGRIMNNGFTAAARFPAMLMDGPITLTNDAATGSFNIKGLEFTTFLDYQFTSPTSGSNVALTDFSHNINPGPFSPFFTEATDSTGTVVNFTAEKGLVGSIVAGAADTTTVSGTVDIVGTATAASNFSNGNQLPEGVTLSYDLNFTISSPDGLLTTSGGNTGNGIGVGSAQFEATDNGERLVFSPATISNITFSGTPTDGSSFVPGTVSDVALTNFRSTNFPEATTGAVLSDGVDSVGFGQSTGSVASNIPINNSFAANARFPGFSLLTNPVTLTADTGAFNLKGFELATIFTYTIGGALKGDCDMDGDIDFDDIPAFITVLQSGIFVPEADCDCSTQVDFGDIPAFITILQSQ
jgi:hypothetical protein